jgi:hypothetical protein
LTAIEGMIAAADFALIPVKPSTVDLLATEDAIVLARKPGTPFLLVFQRHRPQEKLAEKARQGLFTSGPPCTGYRTSSA